jgi:hypothetical protein
LLLFSYYNSNDDQTDIVKVLKGVLMEIYWWKDLGMTFGIEKYKETTSCNYNFYLFTQKYEFEFLLILSFILSNLTQ